MCQYKLLGWPLDTRTMARLVNKKMPIVPSRDSEASVQFSIAVRLFCCMQLIINENTTGGCSPSGAGDDLVFITYETPPVNKVSWLFLCWLSNDSKQCVRVCCLVCILLLLTPAHMLQSQLVKPIQV